VRVVVVGGGIAGLAAARRLEALTAEAEVVLVERDAVPGGKLQTELVEGFVIEAAADSFLARKERGIGLVEELGLGEELIARRPEHQRTYVRRGSDLLPLPEGLTGMIPANLEALERTGLLSPAGRERFSGEVDVPVAPGDAEESVASFVTRRFGREAYEALVEPLMTGIYGGDGEQMSLPATFPQLRGLELEHGSVLRGMSDSGPAAARPPFLSLRTGMATLAEALVADYQRVEVRLGREAVRVVSGYRVELEGGETIEADGVILATPAFVTAGLIAELDDELAAAHAEIPHASSVVVSLAYSRADVVPLDGYGYLVPRVEDSDVLACTWSSQKWEGRAPDGAVLVRVYAGRFDGDDVTALDDSEAVALARDELLRGCGVVAEPLLARVRRWALGMPQYTLGHLERLERIERALSDHPGLAVAGAAYRGVGVPDCIRSGEAAAEAVAQALAGARA